MAELIPNYIDIDYTTLKERIKSIMENSETFKDYNYEGANITMLIELVSYLSELTTFYSNKIAKNVYLDTAELYQTVHSIVSMLGYNPYGYKSGEVDLNVTISLKNVDIGDELYIPPWFKIDTGLQYKYDKIYYSTTEPFTTTVESNSPSGFNFDLKMSEGEYEILKYSPADIIDNKIVLPFTNYNHGTKPYNIHPSITLYVNGQAWTRIENFLNDVELMTDDGNYYTLEFDKYQRYNIKFSNLYNIPSYDDSIRILIQKSFGANGAISANTLTEFQDTKTVPYFSDREIKLELQNFITNLTKNVPISRDDITIVNPEASVNSSDPETLEDMKFSGKANLSSQNRNVTINDFNNHLKSYSSISAANTWGESEQNPGNVLEYNKMYVSIIPHKWGSSTISTVNEIWQTDTEGVSANVYYANNLNDTLKNNMKDYLSSKRFTNIYEEYVLPELVFFAFDIGIKTKRMYNFLSVKHDVLLKLNDYFEASKRSFYETIDFKEIHDYILDETQDRVKYPGIRGINNLIIRDILTYIPSWSSNKDIIYEQNDDNNFPMFIHDPYEITYDNILRPIKLGYNQFPMLSMDNCVFLNEG